MSRPRAKEIFVDVLRTRLDAAKSRGLSERDVAKRARVDPSILSLAKSGVRLKDPSLDLRMRLAVALSNAEETVNVAQSFAKAQPPKELPPDWRELLNRIRLELLQTDIKLVEFGLPLFFDTAPFLVAERRGYYNDLKMTVRFDVFDWHQALAYFETLDHHSDRLRLTIYNRASIESERKSDRIAFCYPLSIYESSGFAFIVRSAGAGVVHESNGQQPLAEALAAFLESTRYKPKIIVAGTDMKTSTKLMFQSANCETQDEWFLILDPFAALDVFMSGLGDAFVGGIPQRLKVLEQGQVRLLATGDGIQIPRQFNGVVCQREDAAKEAARRAVGQVLWGWYRALHDIDEHLEETAEYIVNRMNLYAGRFRYRREEFVTFWKSSGFFVFPRRPSEALQQLQQDPAYTYKLYDETNNFVSTLSLVDTLLP